jgi:hypothetical protein
MGVDFYCGETTFGCSYGRWNNIREDVIQATLEYIKEKFKTDKELYGSLTENDVKWIGKGSIYYSYMDDINEMIRQIESYKYNARFFSEPELLKPFLSVTIDNYSFIDALIYFDIGGLFVLCNKSDCDGLYSVGNSMDICKLFNLIEPNMKNTDSYDTIYTHGSRFYCNTVYELFKESVTNNQKILIS